MKVIKGYDKYSIDEYGVIKNISRDYVLQPRNSGFGGYMTLSLINNEGKRKTKFIHRLVAENFIDNKNNLPIVNHIDGNKFNNHVSNLEWVTVAENIQHAYDTGLHIKASGVDSPNTNLSYQKVHNICASLMGGLKIKSVAELHGVSESIVHNIKNRKCFIDITHQYDLDQVKRYERLSIETVLWVCEMLESGYSTTGIFEITDNKHLTMSRIQSIKARRSFKDLTNLYKF